MTDLQNLQATEEYVKAHTTAGLMAYL